MSDAAVIGSEALLEALLFAAPAPVSVAALASATGWSTQEVEAALSHLEEESERRGFRLQRGRGGLQLVSAPEAAPYIEALLGLDVTLRLTQAAMETLAIVAYAQPVTRPQIESIRGVNSDSTLRTLLSTGLIEELGRADSLGRPILYGTTFEFLQQFGLQRSSDLPPLRPQGNEEIDGASAGAASDDVASETRPP